MAPPLVSSWISPRARKGTPGSIAGRGLVAVEDIGALADEEYEPVMLFVNHSCTPNVGFRGNTVLVAMVDVAAGSELTTDYALFDGTVWPEPLQCACGTASCRGEVTGDDGRRPELQQRYAGWFSTYLADRIAASGSMGR